MKMRPEQSKKKLRREEFCRLDSFALDNACKNICERRRRCLKGWKRLDDDERHATTESDTREAQARRSNRLENSNLNFLVSKNFYILCIILPSPYSWLRTSSISLTSHVGIRCVVLFNVLVDFPCARCETLFVELAARPVWLQTGAEWELSWRNELPHIANDSQQKQQQKK